MRIDFLKNFHDNILFRLETSMLNYNFTGDEVITIQFLIYNVQYNKNIIKSLEIIFILNNLGLSEDLANTTIENIKLGYNKLLPLTMNIIDYNSKLLQLKPIINNGFILIVFINGNSINFVNLMNINNKEKLTLDIDTKFFFDKDYKYVVILNIKYIDGCLNYNINIYTISGQKVLNVLDKKIYNSIFSRTIGNVTNIINSKMLITNITIDINLDLIKKLKPYYKLINLYRNKFFIDTTDLETFMSNSISRVYAAGYYTKQFGC